MGIRRNVERSFREPLSRVQLLVAAAVVVVVVAVLIVSAAAR